jgi:release factor glutamine methyltransferase
VTDGKQWTIGEVLQWTARFFDDKEITNSRLDAEVLLAYVLKTDRLRLYVDFHKPLQPEELSTYRMLIKQRTQRIPVAYLTGSKEFMGLSFCVCPAVLIPRSDTEILVEALLERTSKEEHVRIVDVGSGSGAIIISLLSNRPRALGIAVDISKEALDVVHTNACKLGVAERLCLVHGDLLEPVLSEKMGIIVSNPPYIPTQDIKGLEQEVQKEPVLALDGGPDGLNCYRKLIEQSKEVLSTDGILAFEVGIGQAQQVAALMRETGAYTEIEVIKDYGGIERVVIGRKAAG